MAKVFTITDGLENLGALKTGGQGSVYKGRRVGEIITAIKLLPTPIHNESLDDKNFADFTNEVEKLKKVNESPNPNVVKILSSGVSDTGNFPFIEMEYVEGPELEDLIRPPHHPIFTIKEVLKLAEQLSNAIAHCHKVAVKHGDIKSNNVKFNIHTSNYVLLDFGLAIMSDEQRRTSLRQAGAIEFMAPEQNEGQILFQTDVYSFGVVVFELLAGTVPFPLQDKGETARNIVRINHMEAPPPDVLQLRSKVLPDTWNAEKKEHEMHVPDWLLTMIYKCLEKKPENRFENGMVLHDFILFNSTLANKQEQASVLQLDELRLQNTELTAEKEHLSSQYLQVTTDLKRKEEEITQLKTKLADATVIHTDPAPAEVSYTPAQAKSVPRNVFVGLLLLTIVLSIFTIYSLYKADNSRLNNYVAAYDSSLQAIPQDNDSLVKNDEVQLKAEEDKRTARPEKQKKIQPVANDTSSNPKKMAGDETATDSTTTEDEEGDTLGKYRVVSRAYFHNEPKESTRRDAFIVHWNNATLNAREEQNGFVYVVFTNHLGQTSRGWLRKKDLTRVGD